MAAINIHDQKDNRLEKIVITRNVKNPDPIAMKIAFNLSQIDLIQLIRISKSNIWASSEIKDGRIKMPITQIDHPTAVSISLIIDNELKAIQFFEINSPIKGYGSKLVEAVLMDLPKSWSATVVMDWSGGFWEKMKKRYKKIELF
jgi:hypothetical protein